MSGRSRWSEKVTVLAPDKAASRTATHDGDIADKAEISDKAAQARSSEKTGPVSVFARARQLLVGGIRLIAKTLLPIAVIFAGISAYQYLKSTAPDVRKRAKIERSFAVSTVVAKLGTHTPILRLFGTTTSGRQVDIRALVAGQILATGEGLREGGELNKGDLLVSIDPFNFKNAWQEAAARASEARARLKEQQASRASEASSLKFAMERLKLARTDLERAVPLARRGTVSTRTVDDRRNIVIQREQAVEQLQNSIRVWDARIAQQKATIERMESGVARTKRRLEETKLVAPFDAYVTEVAAQVGRIVSANDKVATLIDRNWIEVRFTLTDAQYGRIIAADKSLAGRRLKVLWRVGNQPLVYSARIERVGAKISADSGGIEIYARIDRAPDGVPLRPGAFVEVQVPDRTYKKVFRLPSSTLFGTDTVYAVENGRLAARKIRQVGIAGNDILVVGDIKPGDHIVRTRLSTPGDGLKVKEHRPRTKTGKQQGLGKEQSRAEQRGREQRP